MPPAGSRPARTSQNRRLLLTPTPSSDGHVTSACVRDRVDAGGAALVAGFVAGVVFFGAVFFVWALTTGPGSSASARTVTSMRMGIQYSGSIRRQNGDGRRQRGLRPAE